MSTTVPHPDLLPAVSRIVLLELEAGGPSTAAEMKLAVHEAWRFWKRVRRGSECWEFLGTRAGHMQYGHYRFMGKCRNAHRVAWTIAMGPIPHGLCVLHRCDNPICVRPEHLFLGTVLENNRDRVRKGRTGPRPGRKSKRAELRELSNFAHPHSKPAPQAGSTGIPAREESTAPRGLPPAGGGPFPPTIPGRGVRPLPGGLHAEGLPVRAAARP